MYTQNDPTIGKEIDGYSIQGILGRGGMGIVYKAEDVALSRMVALKMIDPALSHDENFLRRFRAEAQALARINSPYIVSVYTLRRTDLGLFIVMEYVDGGTLADGLVNGAMPWQQALPILKQGLMALDHAHSVGVIHRDIKPRNIMLTQEGVVKVTDFGLAKLQQNKDVTVTQGIAGTLYYMSPEQVKGLQDVDHRSDLYSFGMTMYEMLAGQLPFDKGSSEFEIMRAIVEHRVPPLDRALPGLPPALAKIIMKSLEKDPAARFQSAQEMLAAIAAFERESGGAQAGGKTRPAAGRPRLLYAGSAAAVIALLAVAVFLLYAGEGPERKSTTVPPVSRTDSTVVNPPDGAQAGSLDVRSTPAGADVYVNDERVGLTPYFDKIAPGRVAVRVVKDGYQTWSNNIDVGAGETESVNATLQPQPAGPTPPARTPSQTPNTSPGTSRPAMASLTLLAEPNGTILVDGKPVDPSAGPLQIEAGRHQVSCGTEAPYRTDRTVDLQAGASQSLTCYFESTVNIVSVSEEEAGRDPFATIWINGENTDEYTPTSLTLRPGTFRIHIQRAGYEVLDGEKTLVVKPDFEKKVHRLVFKVQKANAG